MAMDATVKSSEVAALTLFRRVWKGSDGLVGAQGQFRIDRFIQGLSTQSWRNLGSLLVQLLRPLEREAEPDAKDRWSLHRCLIAAAVTVRYMQTTSEASLVVASDSTTPVLAVNAEFVTKLFAAMARRAILLGEDNYLSATMDATHEVLRTISAVLTAAHTDSRGNGGRSARFAPNAVLDGLLGLTTISTGNGADLLQPLAKRRRTDDSSSAILFTLQLLTRALEQKTAASKHKYAVRILRSQSDTPSRLFALSTTVTSEIAHWQALLVCALADRGLDILDQNGEASCDFESVVVDGVFACLRDFITLVSVPPRGDKVRPEPRARLLSTVGKLCLKLVALFGPLVADGTIYTFCAAKRHRCYQWALLCRLSTWATSVSYTDKGSLSESAAEGGRLCWMHITYTVVGEFESSIWLLLLAESLNHVVLECPSGPRLLEPAEHPHATKPVFTLAEESQVKVFTAVAMVLGRIGRITNALLAKPNPASQSLLPGVVKACARILRLVSPAAASLGLFRPFVDSEKRHATLDDVIAGSADSLNSYVFGLNIPLSPLPASSNDISRSSPLVSREDVAPTLLSEQAREAAEELAHEATIANVFAALNSVVSAIVVEAEGKPLVSSSSFMAFRTILRWINVFTSSARDNVNKQTRLLERDHRDKIRIIVEKARLHKSATDWSRLQSITMARFVSLDTATSNDGNREEITTYRSVVIQSLHALIALSLQRLLGDEYSQPVLLEQTHAWSSEDRASSGGDTPHPALLLCRALKQLLSDNDEELAGVSVSALQILASILGVRSHLAARDITQLHLPHLHVREHSPRSTEALMHLVIQSGLARLMLEPAIVARFTRFVRDGSMLRNPTMLRSMQIWLDMMGNVVRHSLFRSYLSIFGVSTTALLSTIVGSAENRTNLDLSTWWSLALAASTRCLIDVATMEGEADLYKTRLACIMPSHLLSWQAHLPASDIPANRLLDLRRFIASTLETSGSNGRAESIQQLTAWMASFPQPAATQASILYPVYFLSCKLWLNVRAFDRPGCPEQQLPLQICRDIWGISTDALLFLSRLVTQPALRRVFTRLGLVGDFASNVLTKLISRQDYPSLLSCCLRDRSQVDYELSDHEQLLSDDVNDLITIPLVELSSDKFELECQSHLDRHSPTPPPSPPLPSSATDLVGRLLSDISQSRKGINRPTRPTAEYYSEAMLGQLWSQFTKRLLRLPTTIAFSTAASSGDGKQQPVPARSPSERRGELSEWLEDSNGILFDTCAPLLAVREGLAYPSTMWDTLASAVSASDIVFTIREATQQGVSLRTCISAALLLPELYGTAEPLRADVDAVGVLLLKPLVRGLVGSDEDDRQRCLVALLFLAWRQRRCVSGQVAICAAQLKSDVVAMKGDLASSEPCLGMVAAKSTNLAEHDDEKCDLILLSGRSDLLDNNQAVASSVALLVKYSPVLSAMLAGNFAEAQLPTPGTLRRVSLQCDHSTLTGMLDVFHRCVGTLCASSSRQTMAGAAEGLRAELERDLSHDELTAIFELAAYYGLRPVVVFLAWLFAAGFSATKVLTFGAATIDRLTLLYSDDLSGFQASDEFVQAIRRSLAAILLLSLDQVDPASLGGSFVSSASFLLYRVQ
ncbi:hypothetical protein IWW37_003862 [Coemansia sp. RSA 2050]|nr:hypothetical protein IWW37_003862 [Coemansia sp. RSA 2050]